MADIVSMDKAENQTSQLGKAVAPGEWLERLKQVAQESTVAPQQWEQRLAELAMDTLAYQILGAEGALRQELAQELYQAGSLNWLSRQSVREIAVILKGQSAGSASVAAVPQAKDTAKAALYTSPTSTQINQPKPPRKPTPAPVFHVPPELKRLATLVETLGGATSFKADGSWVELSTYDFDCAVAKMTDGLNAIQIREILGVEKLMDEANRRYKLDLVGGKGLSAALLLVAEFVIERQAAQLHPKPRLTGVSEGLVSQAVPPGQAAVRVS